MEEIVDNEWPGDGIIDHDLPLSHTLVHLHTYIPGATHIHSLQEGEGE